MKVVNTKCPNCKASLEMNLDKLMAYCPYCRTALPMDFDVDNYISETEETKRHAQKTEVEKLEVNKKAEMEKNRMKYALIGAAICAIMMALILFSH